MILTTFKVRRGLYFWSMFLASFGIVPHVIGLLIIYFDLTKEWVGMAIVSIGWILMISGQSVVLYSRLHLILNNTKILRGVLALIIFNGVVWHISVTVLLFGSGYGPIRSKENFNTVFSHVEKVQMTFFCLQEFLLSGLYIWKTIDNLLLSRALGNKQRLMYHLFFVNVIIVVMDITLLTFEYQDWFEWERGLKPAIYAIKLKLEFTVLNELIDFVQSHGSSSAGPTSSSRNHRQPGFTQISDSGRKQSQAQVYSIDRTNAIHMGDIHHHATAKAAPQRFPLQHEEPGKVRVTTSIDVQGNLQRDGNNSSTDELFDISIHPRGAV